MFQINLTDILSTQIGNPTFLPLLIRPKQEAQQLLQSQIEQANILLAAEPSVVTAQSTASWITANRQLLLTIFEPDVFLAHYFDRPTFGPIDISTDENIPDHRPFVSQISQRLQALCVLTIFLADRNIVLAPQSYIHPALRTAVWKDYIDGSFEAAVAQAWVEVEKAVRAKAEAHAGGTIATVGRNLMTDVFRTPQVGPPAVSAGFLTDTALEPGVQAGVREVFGGVMTAFRNPPNHRRVAFTREDAYCEIMFASRLLRYVDTRP